MRIVITGVTGLIGSALAARLAQTGCQVIGFTRSPHRARGRVDDSVKLIKWNPPSTDGDWSDFIDGADAVVNLAGESIAAARWTNRRKQKLVNSRLDTTAAITAAVQNATRKPDVLIQASAIGYYGLDGDHEVDETTPPGRGFLGELCRNWEAAAREVEKACVRCCIIRTGVVLDAKAGALPPLVKAFKFLPAGWPGSGKQWLSWITLDDQTAAIEFLIRNPNLQGAFNLTAPEPVRMKQFCKTLAAVLHRPCFFHVPPFLLRTLIGPAADEIILTGRKVLPHRLCRAGYEFQLPLLDEALGRILNKNVSVKESCNETG